ncbi:MAG: hypothetical protein JNL82_06555 [Myxococcales bacterium]|nr:hypothetical protein [Myxococcales bacterium]
MLDETGNPRTGYVLRGPKETRIKSINRSWEIEVSAVEVGPTASRRGSPAALRQSA